MPPDSIPHAYALPAAASGRLRPLAALPPPQLAALHGVLTDIDDTLTADGVIAPAALDALHRLAAAGVPVVAITGRPTGWSAPLALAWPVAAIVAENGAVLLRRQGGNCRLTSWPMPPPAPPTNCACRPAPRRCWRRCPGPRWRRTAPAA